MLVLIFVPLVPREEMILLRPISHYLQEKVYLASDMRVIRQSRLKCCGGG